ncbi:MAG: TonB-dependent receptor [Marinagarivorans sp.]
MLKKTKLSSAIVSLMATTMFSAHHVYAEEAAEEVVVTGIRGALEKAMDIKREAAGVVDAISAEDMGKFPDTNLAESLQRITGVSIDRSNGEGSKITVRGFGPDFNMVTLNGRTLPVGSAYGGSSGADASTRGGNSRAFDFANLASEAVAGVEVYKTGKANVAAGGIGAAVNIKTARPLDKPGFSASVGGKAVMDTTNRTGSDVTPELSGLVSWSDDAEMFGVSLSASYQERDSGFTGATVNGWVIDRWHGGDSDTIYETKASSTIFKNAPALNQLYARPKDVRYTFSDRERDRTNAQLTFQYRPVENVTATLDYTFAQNNQTEHRGEVTTWVQNGGNLTTVEFDNSAIKTPKLITENYGTSRKDIGFSQQYRSQEDTLSSTGLNVKWAVNDELSLIFDAHDSTMESVPTGPGHSGELDVGVGAPIKSGASWWFSGQEIPTWTHTIDGTLDEKDLSSSVLRVWSAEQLSDVTQAKVDAQWKFDDGRFDFGIERREMGSNTISYNGNQNQVLGGWGASAPGEFPAGSFEPFDVAGEFNDAGTGNSPHIGFRADARQLAAALVAKYTDKKAYIGVEDKQLLDKNGKPEVRNSRSNNDIQENTDAIYAQLSTKGALAGLEIDVLAGLRYESTNQISSSDTPPVDRFTWSADNDFTPVSKPAGAKTVVENNYDVMLPNLDLSSKLTDDVVARVSFSKTMARPGLSQLGAATSFNNPNGSTLLAGNTPTATGNNPKLQPLTSDNVDISVEWYFDDASYVSAGVFEKRVANFVGTEQVSRKFPGILDQTAGPRAQAARAALQSVKADVDSGSIFAMMQILANPTKYPAGAAAYTPELKAYFNSQNPAYPVITPTGDDPEMTFNMSSPVNNREAKIYGAEFAGQHFFGDTGFGLQANYTIVRGDIKFDVMNLDANQFALLGLSDTANLVLMYEKYGVEARLAYNWRDEFLNRTGVGVDNPGYIEAYSQIDANVTYHITDDLSVSFEGLNLTGEDRREHARSKDMMVGYDDLGARYQLGARYNF